MPEQEKVDNTDNGSSPSSAGEGAASQDVNSDKSSTSQSATKGGEMPMANLEKVLEDRFKELTKSDSQSDGEEEADGDVQSLNKTEEEAKDIAEGDKEVVDGNEEHVDEEQETEKGPVPYDRFDQVRQERDTIKQERDAFEVKAKAQDQLKDYLDNAGINRDEFAQALELAALMKSDPVEFGKRMKPLLEGVGVLAGETLPKDIQDKVDNGTIDAETAKELAQLRARQTHTTKHRELSAKQQAERQQAEFVQSITKTWGDWTADMTSKYPDFKPRTNGGREGLFEMVNDKMTAMATAVNAQGQPLHPIRSQADALALANAAFKSVMLAVKGVMPKPVAKRSPLSSNGSSTTQQTKDPLKQKTFEGAMEVGYQQILSKHRR